MILFLKLLLAHMIGDFLLQPKSWVRDKEEKRIASKYLYVHVLLQFAVAMVLLWDIDYWKLVLLITISHYLIDLAKIHATPWFENRSIPFFIDQLLHLAVLYVCSYYGDLLGHSRELLGQIDWALVTATVFVTFPSAVIMEKLLERMSRQIELDHESLSNAGKYIGIIERLFVLTFLVLGRWEAVGLLITAKSVFRFNDLKESNNRKLTEYILIGTLLSFGIAIGTGLLYTKL
jgi:hypothetical protein